MTRHICHISGKNVTLGRMWRSRTRKCFIQLVTVFVTSFPKNVTFWPKAMCAKTDHYPSRGRRSRINLIGLAKKASKTGSYGYRHDGYWYTPGWYYTFHLDVVNKSVYIHERTQARPFQFFSKCVLICFVDPILGNRYGPGVNSLRQ